MIYREISGEPGVSTASQAIEERNMHNHQIDKPNTGHLDRGITEFRVTRLWCMCVPTLTSTVFLFYFKKGIINRIQPIYRRLW